MEEGQRSLEMDLINIDAAADSIGASDIFHVFTDVLGFILFMHQQIPSVLQEITHEFDDLRNELKELEVELAKNEANSKLVRRKQAARKREVKMGIRKFEKLMNCISNVKTAVHLMIEQVPNVEQISLLLGPSPLRPLHVYELNFSQGRAVSGEFSRSRVAEALSRKAILMMISRDVGSSSCAGPTKLFVFMKAPANINLPLHFLPKREFKQNRKTVPFRLKFRCKAPNPEMIAHPNDLKSASEDFIWYQCRHTIKGLASTASSPED